MTRRFRAGLIFLVLFLVASPAMAANPGNISGNANLFLGGKFLDENDWTPAEDQVEVGVMLDLQPPQWPLSLAADFLFGFSDGAGVDVEIHEYDLGVRKVFEIDPIAHPYIGGGLTIATAELSGFGASIEDTGFGAWLGGGFFATISEHWNIGIDMRISTAGVTLGGFDFDAGGFHIGLITGMHW